MSFLKRAIAAQLALCLFFLFPVAVEAEGSAAVNVSARAAILIRGDTGEVLFEHNGDECLPMASTTKIMTALLTLECGGLDDYFTVDPGAVHTEGTSMGLQEGDQVTLRGLAYGMLLASGNDAANVVAVRIAGSISAFVEMMNTRAKMLGMEHTSFETPSGLDGENHYSTAKDMALLTKAALENPAFAEICSSQKVCLEYGNPPYKRWMTNHNRLLKEYDGCIGVKTGFTKKAGRCLVSAAERDGVRLIAVTLSDPNDWNDHKAMFDYGFSIVESTAYTPDFSGQKLHIVGGEADETGLVSAGPVTLPVGETALSELETVLYMRPFEYAPVKEGNVVGRAEFWYHGAKIGETSLLAGETVQRKTEDSNEKETGFLFRLWQNIRELFGHK